MLLGRRPRRGALAYLGCKRMCGGPGGVEISKPEDAVDTRLTALDRAVVLATEPPPTGEEIEPKGASGRSLVGAWAWSRWGGA